MRCNIVSGTVVGSSDGQSFEQSVTHDVGPDFQWVTVVLNGWDLNGRDERRVQRMRIQIDAPRHDRGVGSVTFAVRGDLQGREATIGYDWSVSYTILAFGSATPSDRHWENMPGGP